MDLEDIKISTCKYKISMMTLACDGLDDPFPIQNSMISTMILERKFDTHKFPYFELSVTVPNYIYRILQKQVNTKKGIKANICIQIGLFSSDYTNTNARISFSNFLKGTFRVDMDDSSPDISENDTIKLEKETGIAKGMTNNDGASFKMALYNEKYFVGSKMINNEVMNNPTLVDALVYTLNKSGINNVLLSPVTNNVLPTQFILLPLICMEQLDHLTTEYSMHANGSMVFFDLDKCYIIDKSPKCTAFTKNEYKKTFIVSYAQSRKESKSLSGSYANDQEKYYVCNIAADKITIRDESITNEQLRGNNLVYIDAERGTVSNIDSGNTSLANGPTGIVFSKKGSTSTSEIKNSIKSASCIIDILLDGCNLDFLSPNKEFVLTFDDSKMKKYNGSYRIATQITTFRKDGDLFTPATFCTFKK